MARKGRKQTRTQLRRPGFRPAASPVDTFENPRGGSKLAQLAGALSQVAPGLNRYAVQKQEIQDAQSVQDADRQAAEDQEILQEMELTYREAREQGIIQEHQDPVFMARYNEQLGRGLGERASADWQAVKADALLEATTLEEYDGAFNEFYDSWTDGNLGGARSDNPALAVAFRQTAQRFLANDRRSWAQQAGAKLAGLSDDAFTSTINQGVYNRIIEGQSVSSLAGYISDELEAHIGLAGDTRGKRARINRLAVASVLAAAERAALQSDLPGQSMAVLEALRAVPTGSGTLGTTLWAQGMISDAESKILQNIRGAELLFDKEQQNMLNDIVEEATDTIFEAGAQADLIPFQQAINNLGIGQQAAQATIRSLEATRSTMVSAADRSVPEVRRSILQGIFASPGDFLQHNMDIQAALANHTLSTGDAQNLYQQARTYKNAAGGDGVYSDGAYDRMSREFRLLFGSETMSRFTNADAIKREQGMAEYNRAWRDWAIANPDADTDQKEEYLLRLSERLKARYSPGVSTGFGAVPRDPRLPGLPEWNVGPVTTPETWGVLEAAYNQGTPLAAFPVEAKEAVFNLLGSYGLTPTGNVDQILELIEAQRPFFTEPTNNDQER